MRTSTIQSLAEFNIDLSQVCAYEEKAIENEIVATLKKNKLLGKEFIYSVFDYDFVEQLRETGCTTLEALNKGIFYGFQKEQLVWDDGTPYCIRNYAEDSLDSGIAIFNSRLTVPAYEGVDSKYAYLFKDPSKKQEALVGIARLIQN